MEDLKDEEIRRKREKEIKEETKEMILKAKYDLENKNENDD
jgi:hypothetical protein